MQGIRGLRIRRVLPASVLAIASVVMAVGVAPVAPSTPATAAATHRTVAALPLLHATRGDRAAIVDSQGRQVLLRGVNLNSLGDYYQANASYAPTVPVTNADWDSMAAQGFSVVRLLVSWSFLEPSPGTIDATYIAKIHAAVDAAAARGMYTVIDMHQDAWGKFIGSPPNVVCPSGLTPSIGWDGAPQWATYTDGAQTCHGANREDSDADRHAWDNFYADHNGIQTHLVNVWQRLGQEFGPDTAVAGYDLLNEPNSGATPDTSGQRLGAFYGRAISAIRSGENAAGGPHHIAFVEPTVDLHLPPGDFSTDGDVAAVPHNYAESISDISIETAWDLIGKLVNSTYHATAWIGEYGWFGDPAQQKSKLIRYAKLEDAHFAGSAWWQWRQACGDPHTIGSPNGTPGAVVIQYQRNLCPGDVNQGPIPEWQSIVTRPYPRAFPGLLTALGSNGDARTMYAAGDASGGGVGGTFDVWVPGSGSFNGVNGTGIAGVTMTTVAGGTRVTGTVCSPAYTVQIGGGSGTIPATCPPPPATSTTTAVADTGSSSTPATPVSGNPRFTG